MEGKDIQRLLVYLADIATSLKTLAEYAEMLRVEATGEKVYEIGSYVVGTSSKGDARLHLYATHPGLEYRITTVYVERFGELPFTPDPKAKLYDGDVALGRASAAQKGYLMPCEPFRISLLPTGQTTDAGLPVHRFNRVLDGGKQERQERQDEPQPVESPADDGYADAEREWAEMESASKALPVPERKVEQPGPKVSRGAEPLPPAKPVASAAAPSAVSATAVNAPKGRLPASMAGVANTFKAWGADFAKRRPHYATKDGEVDMYHILCTAASLGFPQVTPDNIEEVKSKLEAHAK